MERKMKEKYFFCLICGIMGSIALSIPVCNYAIDYYGVFRGANQEVIGSDMVNDRFVKMEYLLQNYHFQQYDSYLWGSSRVKKTDSQVTGQRTYNMGSSAGMPEDCLRDLRMLVAHGANIDTVYLGLDNFSYFTNYEEYLSADIRFPYNEQEYKRYSYYAKILMRYGIIKAWGEEKLKHNFNGKTMLYQTGTYIVPEAIEKKIQDNTEQYVNEIKFKEPSLQKWGGVFRFEKCMEIIRQIKQLCDENHIRFVPFFNPQHMTTYLASDMELMNRFKKELVKISPFWDFSGVNYVTSNNYFWYETSHPRAFICDKILDTVSGQNQITWVPDFGVYVTEENVDAFCDKAVRDREAYDPNHEQWVPSVGERAVMTKRVNYPW